MSVKIDLTATNADKMIADLMDKTQRRLIAQAEDGVNAALSFLLSQVIPITPMRTGLLRGEFRIKGASFDGRRVVGGLTNAARYAGFVHSMPDSYNFTTPGTGPLYIHRPMRRYRKQTLEIMQSKLSKSRGQQIGIKTSRLDRGNW